MSGPINRPPLGLLSLFDVRGAGGTYPSQLADFIQPTIEQARFCRGQAGQENVEANFAVTAAQFIPFANSLRVPQDEFWWVSEFVCINVLAADQAIRIQPVYYAVQLGVLRPLPLAELVGEPTALGTVGAFLATSHYDMPRLIPPGSALSANVAAITVGAAGNVNVIMHARIIRLRA